MVNSYLSEGGSYNGAIEGAKDDMYSMFEICIFEIDLDRYSDNEIFSIYESLVQYGYIVNDDLYMP